ncbi:MAG: J domain-containing protein [Myxococcaceae bacterium]
MKARATAAQVEERFDTLDQVEVECTHCGRQMSTHLGSGRVVRYFQCASCSRWVSSVYREVLNSSANVRSYPKKDDGPRAQGFDNVKSKLERWLAAIDDQDPYRTVGCSPMDSDDVIRSKYRVRAMQCHPDRGGSDEQMRELNVAYERILSHRERRKVESLPAGAAEVPGSLPARSR